MTKIPLFLPAWIGLLRKKYRIQSRAILVISFFMAHMVFLRPQPVKILGDRQSSYNENTLPFYAPFPVGNIQQTSVSAQKMTLTLKFVAAW